MWKSIKFWYIAFSVLLINQKIKMAKDEKEEKDESKPSEQLNFPYTSTILPESAVSELKSIDGKIEPINLVEYRDDQNEVVTPLPLYIPKKEIEDELTRVDDPKIK